MIMLFGGNPVVVFIAGIVLIAGGLALHATILPWIGGALLIVGAVKMMQRRNQGRTGSQNRR